MKSLQISVVTVTFNSESTLADTLRSVASQDYAEVEHILVDGGSIDGTVDIIKSFPHVKKWVSEQDRGLYDAINKGIQMARGDVVGILNSDDFFPDNQVLSSIAQTFLDHPVEAVYGDIAFVKPTNLKKIIRLYRSAAFSPRKFAFGYMPAHPSFYVKRDVYKRFGLYKLDYKIAADYELLMRFLYRNHLSCRYIDKILVYMRTGGVSNKSIFSRYILNKEIIQACRENGVNTNMAILSIKYLNKVFEYINPILKNIGK
ncbi:MAG: glycosyltransferase family 2 protein [Chitinophagaceae bacterium]